MRSVCYFRQALALDECRAAYMPEYAGKHEETTDSESLSERPHILEVWFAGKHFDVYVLFTLFK